MSYVKHFIAFTVEKKKINSERRNQSDEASDLGSRKLGGKCFFLKAPRRIRNNSKNHRCCEIKEVQAFGGRKCFIYSFVKYIAQYVARGLAERSFPGQNKLQCAPYISTGHMLLFGIGKRDIGSYIFQLGSRQTFCTELDGESFQFMIRQNSKTSGLLGRMFASQRIKQNNLYFKV